jgi:hypothetical protein
MQRSSRKKPLQLMKDTILALATAAGTIEPSKAADHCQTRMKQCELTPVVICKLE